MAIQIQFRRGTSSEWTNIDPTLAEGELGYEVDTYKFKIGTGTTSWNYLSYVSTSIAEIAGIATYATTAGIATYATTAGIATYATTAGIATYATTAGIASALTSTANVNTSGIITATGGFNIGISSAGTNITSGPITALNFIGVGNTFEVNGTTVDISISSSSSGGSSGGLATPLSDSDSNPLSEFFVTQKSLSVGAGSTLFINTDDDTTGKIVFTRYDEIVVSTGATVHIGAGTTLKMNVLGVF